MVMPPLYTFTSQCHSPPICLGANKITKEKRQLLWLGRLKLIIFCSVISCTLLRGSYSLSPRPKHQPQCESLSVSCVYWKQYTCRMRSGDETRGHSVVVGVYIWLALSPVKHLCILSGEWSQKLTQLEGDTIAGISEKYVLPCTMYFGYEYFGAWPFWCSSCISVSRFLLYFLLFWCIMWIATTNNNSLTTLLLPPTFSRFFTPYQSGMRVFGSWQKTGGVWHGWWQRGS